EDDLAFLREIQPGALAIFNDNVQLPDQLTRLTNSFQQAMQDAGAPPLLIAVDQEGGVVARLNPEQGFTRMPTPMLLAAAGPAMAAEAGQFTAQELLGVGIQMNLAPVADLETNPDNPIIYRRAFSNDPVIGGEAVAAFIRGAQAAGGLTTAKHFPGHGETSVDSHAELAALDLTRERLDAVELPPFRAAIEAGVDAVMVAHIWYPALDPDRVPASLSPNVITGLLRGDLGYDGLVLTDALDMNAVDLQYEFGEAAVRAVEAGADVLPLGPSIGRDAALLARDAIVNAVASGRIPESRLDEAIRRIFAAKERTGLFGWQPLDPASAAARVNTEAGDALIEQLFVHGATVAYDHADLVPVPAGARVAVIFLATRYQIQQECSRYTDPVLTRWVGVGDNPSSDEIGWAVEAANAADVAIVFTQDAIRNPAQQALVNALPPEKTAAVALWSPYDWQTYPNVAAYALTYSPLRPAVPAICAVLFGAQPGLGQLALTLGPNLPAGSRDGG
ncbi:MAG TPA: glycoside hydrolase family 3 protein, partial [Candidatus Limnocylindrales bacterium]|nr:glycoside hydrolase family 3 protein [Candidatus Limnocylindrales bacterium]